MRSGFPTGAHWRDQKGGSFRASCLSHTSASLAAMVWCATFFDHQFRGIRFFFFFFRGKDGDGKSTEHPWGSRKMGTYKHISRYIRIYTSYSIYIDTNRCISRRGVYWSPSFGGTDLKYFLLPQMTWRSPLATWKMLGRTWWLRLVGVPNLEVYSLNLGPQWPTHPSLYKDGAFFKQNPLKRTSTKRLVKYSSFESGWLTSIGFLRSPKFSSKKYVGQDWLWKIWFESTSCTVSSQTFK